MLACAAAWLEIAANAARQTNVAVGATAGKVLTWKGRVALTYYSSTSGGRTEAVADAFPQVPAVPYLVAVSDPYDGLSPHHRYRLRVRAALRDGRATTLARRLRACVA